MHPLILMHHMPQVGHTVPGGGVGQVVHDPPAQHASELKKEN